MEIIKPKVAIIGTAGRDKTKNMNRKLWQWMLNDARSRLRPGAHLVSGGAAWADHLAVELFLSGYASALTLHLPAPMNEAQTQFVGEHKSAGGAANYYHRMFSNVLGRPTILDISRAANMEHCDGSFEPSGIGMGAFFARNAKVAKVDQMLAYTFGQGDVPADGGTKHTWDLCKGQKLHVTLPDLPF